MQKIISFIALNILLCLSFTSKGQIDCSVANTLQCGSPWSMLIDAGVGNDNFSYCGFQNDGNEAYYAIEPTVSGNYFIQIEEFAGTSTSYEMRYGECSGNIWNCLGIYAGNATTDFIYLSTGQVYVFCIDVQSSTENLAGSITLNCPAPAPSNDECNNAQNISCNSTLSGTLNGATSDNVPNCLVQGNGEEGVWYSYTGNNSYVTLSTCGASLFDTQISVYSGDCLNLYCVAANDDNPLCESNGSSSYISFNALAGTNYFIRVHANTQPNSIYNFTLNCSCSPLCIAPSNDNCNNAISLGSISNAACTNYTSSSTACATASNIQPSCFSAFNTLSDVWYTFSPIDNDIELVLNANYTADIGVAVYDGTCGNFGSVFCSANASSVGGTVIEELTAGNTYYLQFFSLQNASGDFTFCLSNPTCSTPLSASVSNISSTNAFLQWTSLNATGAFDILLTTTNLGTDINSQNITNATIYGVPFTATPLSNLQENTTYYAYVRQDCGIVDHSLWSNVISFTTNWSAPNCQFTPDFNCGSTYSLTFGGYGSLSENNCGSALGREFVFNYTPTLTGTYILNLNSNATNVAVSFKENDGTCNYSNATCIGNNNGNFYIYLTSGISYSIWIDGLTSDSFNTTASWICPSIGEDPSNAFLINSTYFPIANAWNGTLINSTPTAAFGSNNLNKHDKWGRFTALTAGASVSVTSAENIRIELRNANLELIDSEDLTSTGSEILNASNLTAGQTYFVGIISENNLLGTGAFSLSVRQLKNGACGNNPSSNFSMGQFFKAQPATGASYRFQLHGTSGTGLGQNALKNQSTPQLILSSVFPSLHFNSNYEITVSNVYTLTNGAGQTEVITMPSSSLCTITITNQPLSVLRYTDRCIVTTKPRVSFIGGTPFVFGASGWTWRFQKLDSSGNPVGNPIQHNVLNATNYLNIGNVSLLEYGTSYAVDCAPVFSYGAGNYGNTYTMCIAPLSGFTSENNDRNVIETNEENTGILLYPNPTQNNCSISSNKAIERILVYDLGGRKIEDYFVNGSIRFELNTSNYSSGIFYVEIQTEENMEVKKLVVSH
ncbi:MAG: hypothetical protein RJA38_251 [Bacteroidota bacterium]|jgi:hypothetical protein